MAPTEPDFRNLVQKPEWVEVGPLRQVYYIKLNVEDLNQFGDEFEEQYGGLSIVMQHAAYMSQVGTLYGSYTWEQAHEDGEADFANLLVSKLGKEGIRWQCTPSAMEVHP